MSQTTTYGYGLHGNLVKKLRASTRLIGSRRLMAEVISYERQPMRVLTALLADPDLRSETSLFSTANQTVNHYIRINGTTDCANSQGNHHTDPFSGFVDSVN